MVTTVAELNDKRTGYVSAVWELDPAGQRPARRLTRSANGESSPTFTADGDLLFLSSRPKSRELRRHSRPPRCGGCRSAVARRSRLRACRAAISAVRTARAAETTVVGAAMLPAARDIDDDRRLRDLRKDGKVTAILHTDYPVRFWNTDIGPDEPHLLDADGPRDLTPDPGAALLAAGFGDADFDISADGSFLVTTWQLTGPGPTQRSVLMRVDLASGERRVIADDPGANLDHPAIAPDGTAVAFTRDTISTSKRAPRMTLQYMRFGDQPRPLAQEWDRRPSSITWSSDGATLVVTADQHGRAPMFAVDVATSTVTQLTDDDFAYTDVVAAPGGVLYALRSSYAAPPHPVRIDPDGAIMMLPCVDLPTLPGTLTEIAATTPTGTTVRSWLVLPDDAAPAPLLLWVHGGPLGSWNSWAWRWNPWLMARAATRCCCPTRRCRPATGRTSSSAAGALGVDHHSTT